MPSAVPAALVTAGLAVAAVLLAGAVAWCRVSGRLRARTRELRDLTERHRLQAHVLSQVTDAIVVTDRQGRIRTWNSGAEALFGRTEGEAVGRPVGELVMHRLVATRQGDLTAAMRDGDIWIGDAEIIRPGHSSVFVEASVRGVVDEAGVPQGHLIVAHDIDMRQRAELEARQRARQQAAIASLGQRALAGIDFQWLVDQAMSVMRSTLHLTAAAVFERTADEGWLTLRAGEGWDLDGGPDVRIEHLRNVYPGYVLAQTAASIVCDHRTEQRFVIDGFFAREGIVISAAVAIPGRAGAYGVLLVADRRDRTFSRDDMHFLQAVANVIGAAFERAAMDRELRSELALHNATLESTAEGIFVTDENDRVTRYNQRMVEMWGYPPEVLASDRAEDWVRWGSDLLASPVGAREDFRRAADSDQVDMTVLVMKDGRVFERHAQPQRVDGRVVGHVWCYRDVTDRVRAEDERRRLESQMQHVQKLESLGVMAGGIAHDFNNLLVGILGNAGLALLDAPPGIRDRIKQIEVAAQRAAELTNQMLAYSGKGRFILRRTDLSELVKEIAGLLRTAATKTADLALHLAADPVAFDGDPAQIRQVIMNLITNASDAIGSGAGRIDVTTGRMTATRDYLADACVGADQPEGEFVFAEVRDTGAGMDAATITRIFDPFFTTKFTGRGLGLAAVLGIVRGHGGAIKIASAPGAGTTFRVLLPAREAAVPEREPVVVPLSDCTGATVLVVDDEASVRRVASEVLSRAGFQVTLAAEGEEALEIVRARTATFDAVLLDMTMPRLSGVETFRVLRELCPSLRVVLTSGYSEEDAAERFDSDGLAGFIQKPFLPQALVRAMSEAVGRPQEVTP
jgi:PAS domain S-box-containing protein